MGAALIHEVRRTDGQNVCNKEFLGAFAKLRKVTISFVMSARPSVSPNEKNSASTEKILIKFGM